MRGLAHRRALGFAGLFLILIVILNGRQMCRRRIETRDFVGYGCNDDMLILKPILISCSLLLWVEEYSMEEYMQHSMIRFIQPFSHSLGQTIFTVRKKAVADRQSVKRFFLCQKRSVSQHDVAKRRNRKSQTYEQRQHVLQPSELFVLIQT